MEISGNEQERELLVTAIVMTLVTLGTVACSKPSEPTASAPAVPTANGNVADINVNQHVTTALQQSEALKAFDITVVTLNGDVRLSGVLDTQAQIDEAIRIARAAEGNHSVHDELVMKK